MCSDWCIDFVSRAKPFIAPNALILEVGARDVNGSPRVLFPGLGPKYYLGVDIEAGPGVDEIVDVKDLTDRFGQDKFDVVISTEMLEHCADWQTALFQMLTVLKKEGLLILSTRSPGFPLHDYPADHWRFNEHHFSGIFSPIGEILHIESDFALGFPCGIGIAFRKTAETSCLVDWKKSLYSFAVVDAHAPFDNATLCGALIFDQYSRYRACAEAVESIAGKERLSVIDIGSGESCLLGHFLAGCDIVYADPLLVRSGKQSPNCLGVDAFSPELDGRSYDIALAIDTFEHIPAEKRPAFLERISGLAKRAVIIACPCRDEPHAIQTDNYVNDAFRSLFGKDYPWLSEHFLYGLPSSAEVLEFFQSKGWSVAVQPHGHCPWLKELLSFVVCAIEVPILWDVVKSVSQIFNSSCYAFDCAAPAYRQILIACREPFSFATKTTDPQDEGAQNAWQAVRMEIVRGMVSVLQKAQDEQDKARKKLDEFGQWGLNLDRQNQLQSEEIKRLNLLLQQITEWATRTTEDISQRDAEISRLNKLLQDTTAWAQKAAQDVSERDNEILRLNKVLQDLSG